MTPLEQLQKRVSELETLLAKIATPEGQLILPVISNEQRLAFWKEVADSMKDDTVKKAVLTILPKQDATTGVGVPPPTPVTAAPPAELLPDSISKGFKLTGEEKKQHPIELIKGATYKITIDLKSATDGGARFLFVRPGDNNGIAYQKLVVGKNQFVFTAAVTETRLWSVEGNRTKAEVTAASLTKQPAA